MTSHDTPDTITRTRTVKAETILNNRIDLRSYPHRILAIHSQNGIGPERMTYTIAAAEILTSYGWHLINISEFGQGRVVYAVMHRTQH
jgi:hypothetical protein